MKKRALATVTVLVLIAVTLGWLGYESPDVMGGISVVDRAELEGDDTEHWIRATRHVEPTDEMTVAMAIHAAGFTGVTPDSHRLEYHRNQTWSWRTVAGKLAKLVARSYRAFGGNVEHLLQYSWYRSAFLSRREATQLPERPENWGLMVRHRDWIVVEKK